MGSSHEVDMFICCSLRWAYQSNVMKMLDSTNSRIVKSQSCYFKFSIDSVAKRVTDYLYYKVKTNIPRNQFY